MTTVLTTKHLVNRQLPRYVREANPLFQKFLEYYYEFQENSKIPDIIQEIRKYNDIDSVEESFLSEFFEEFRRIPATIVADKRLVAKHIYDIFKTKGSEQSLKLLFRIVYGEEIDIRYPSENILRASDGRWIQDVIVTLNAVQGNITEFSNRIKFSNNRGNFEFEIKKIESIDQLNVRVYFEPLKNYFIEEGQIFNIYCNQSLNFVGRLTPMPATVEVLHGGKDWRIGQVFRLQGSYRDTICRVKNIGDGGKLLSADIIDHGLGYQSDEEFLITPYGFKPTKNTSDITTKINTTNPSSLSYNLNIQDSISGTIDSITGTDLKQTYVNPNYSDPLYISRLVIQNIMNAPSDIEYAVQTEVAFNDWVDSITRVRIKNRHYAKGYGYYDGVKGQLSNPEIKIQDGFYYQIFSYVIETYRMLCECDRMISLVHPAGMKYFSRLTKEANFSVNSTVTRTQSIENILLLTNVSTNETISKQVIDNISDEFEVSIVDDTKSYDVNNKYELYNPSSDEWDAIELKGVGDDSYEFQQYDLQEYDITSLDEPVIEQYTDEQAEIVIQLNGQIV
jgi:hypothetical protein